MLSSASPSINTLMSDDYIKSNSYLVFNSSHINSSIITMNDFKILFIFLFSVVASNNPKILVVTLILMIQNPPISDRIYNLIANNPVLVITNPTTNHDLVHNFTIKYPIPFMNNFATSYDLENMAMTLIDKTMVFMKRDELADPNIIIDLILHYNPSYHILLATTSSKPLDMKLNHTKEIVHTEANHMDIERLPTLNPSYVYATFHLNSSIPRLNSSMPLTLLSSVPSMGDFDSLLEA